MTLAWEHAGRALAAGEEAAGVFEAATDALGRVALHPRAGDYPATVRVLAACATQLHPAYARAVEVRGGACARPADPGGGKLLLLLTAKRRRRTRTCSGRSSTLC